MSHDEVQSLVARYLVDAGSSSADLPVSELSAVFGPDQLERLSLFRGFITKVKHNSLRSVLPCTFRLLSVLGEELSFFRTYASTYLSMRSTGPLALDRQLAALETALRRHFNDDGAPTDIAINDMLTHETLPRRIRSRPLVPDNPGRRAAITWRGTFDTQRYRIDVMTTSAALAERIFDRDRHLVAREHILAYWRTAGADRIDIFEIDELTQVLFSLVDQRRGLVEIAAALSAMGLDELTLSDLEDFFADAAQRGIVALEGRRGGRHGSRA